MMDEAAKKEAFEKCTPILEKWLQDAREANLNLWDLMLVTSFLLGHSFDTIKAQLDPTLDPVDFAQKCHEMIASACGRQPNGSKN